MVSLAVHVVGKSVELCSDPDVKWGADYNDGECLFVVCAQVRCDRSQLSLSPSVVFYLLCLTLLKFLEEQFWKVVSQRVTLLAYLSVSLQWRPGTWESFTHESKVSQNLMKRLQLKVLHKWAEACFHPLTAYALTRMPQETVTRSELKARVILASYVADISESEHHISMRIWSQTAFQCHRCLVLKAKTIQVTSSRKKTFFKNKRHVESIQFACRQCLSAKFYVSVYSSSYDRAIIFIHCWFLLFRGHFFDSRLPLDVCVVL